MNVMNEYTHSINMATMFVPNIIQNTTSCEVTYFSMTLPHKISWSCYVALLTSLTPQILNNAAMLVCLIVRG